MRLTEKEQLAIKEVIQGIDPEAKIYLFGSRADDNQLGGDIDLLIFSQMMQEREKKRFASLFTIALENKKSIFSSQKILLTPLCALP